MALMWVEAMRAYILFADAFQTKEGHTLLCAYKIKLSWVVSYGVLYYVDFPLGITRRYKYNVYVNCKACMYEIQHENAVSKLKYVYNVWSFVSKHKSGLYCGKFSGL